MMSMVGALVLALFLSAPVHPAAAQSAPAEGVALVQQGRYREAKPLLERAVKAEPKNAAALHALGLVHLNSDQDFEKAAACFEKAAALDERNAEHHYQLGVAYGRIALTAGKLRQVGLAAKVKRQGLKTIELDPRHIEARNGMIQFYMAAPGIMGGNKEKAREQAAEVARLDPYQGELSWALIASSERNNAELEKRYKAALALNPDGWQALQSYGSFCLRRNRADEALEMLSRLAALRPDDPRSHESLGDALAAKGREAESLQSYDRALALRPDYDPVVFKLARFHERKGDTARAAELYARYLDLVKTGRRADQARSKLRQWGKSN
jgi:Tfp pilus assembly protein PilF